LSETLHFESLVYTEPDIAEIAEAGDVNIDFDSLSIEVAGTDNQKSEADESKAEKDDSNTEASKDNWDAQLTNFVSANANKLVIMAGVEMTLSEAMFLIPFNKDNVDMVYAQVKQMVAEAEAKNHQELEELEGQIEEAEKEEILKAEDNTAKIKEDDRKTDVKNEKPKAQEKLIKADIETPAAKQTARNEHQIRPIDKGTTTKTAVAAKVSNDLAGSAQGAVIEKPAQKPGAGAPPDQPLTRAYQAESAPVSGFAAEVRFEPTESRQPVGQGSESFLAETAEPASEAVEPLDLEAADAYLLEDAAAPEVPRTLLDEPELIAIDSAAALEAPADFTEAEVPINHLGEVVLDAGELYELAEEPALAEVEARLQAPEEVLNSRLDIEAAPSELAAITSMERIIPGNLAIEETEFVLTELGDQLKTLAPETSEAVAEILDKIIEAPIRLEASDGAVITEAAVQEELEELFTELLNRMGIDYSPELIESLARLTISRQLADSIGNLKDEEELDKLPRDTGTHEIIKKLLAALGAIRKAVAQASTIGKSALQLCAFGFAV
jgi:hypothetical protein